MAQVTVQQLAETVGTPVERLLEQLHEAGLPHRAADEPINDTDKAQLLKHLQARRGSTRGCTVGLNRRENVVAVNETSKHDVSPV